MGALDFPEYKLRGEWSTMDLQILNMSFNSETHMTNQFMKDCHAVQNSIVFAQNTKGYT